MRNKALIVATAIGASALWTGIAFAEGQAGKPGMARDLDVTKEQLWSNLDEASVVGPGGEQIAEVKNLVVEEDGTIKHIILGRGGVLDIGEKLVAVEPAQLKPSLAEPAFTTTMTGDELKEAEEFKFADDDAAMTESGWVADRLIGMSVVDESGEEISEIEDLLVSEDKVTHVLLSAAAVPGMAGTTGAAGTDAAGTTGVAGTAGQPAAPGTGAAGDAGAASTGASEIKTPEERAAAGGDSYIAVPFGELAVEQGSTADEQKLVLKGGKASLETAEQIRFQ